MNAENKIIKIKGQFRGRRPDPDALRDIRELLADRPVRRDLLVEYLHLIQDRFHQLAASHLVALAEELQLSISEVYEVATFYHHFDVVEDDAKAARLTIRVCNSITCEMFGANRLIEELKNKFKSDIRIQAVPCVGRSS